LAHDLFEGVVDWDLTDIISELVAANWFTYESLQRHIRHFQCTGPDMNNKPSEAVSEKKLSGHAVQNWTLVRLLPFILQDKIQDPSNEYWQLYLLLKKVVEYACSPEFKESDLKDFTELLNKYMTKRSELLKTQVKPKHHFLMHYPDLIRLLGPLIFLFTLRFESKHQFLKRIAKACKNFINLGFTLSYRHQIYLCYLRTGVIYPDGIGPTKICKKHASAYGKEVIDLLKIVGDVSVYYKSLEIDGIVFKNDSYLMLDGKKKVGQIKAIAAVASQVWVVLKEYRLSYWSDYGVYRLEPLELTVLNISSLSNPHFQSVYELKDELCISPKYFLPSPEGKSTRIKYEPRSYLNILCVLFI
jgi:hypothetical protein